MIKRLVALVLATTILLTLGACKKKQPDAISIPVEPGTAEEAAVNFVKAFYAKDYLTLFSLYIHDERQQWIDTRLKGQTEEEFLAEAQRQADEKGMDVTIQTLDDYFTEFHKRFDVEAKEQYGAYTITADVTATTKLDEAALSKLIGEVNGGFSGTYVNEELLGKITEGHHVTVDYRITGEKKEYHQPYEVYVVLCDGKWLVANHTI